MDILFYLFLALIFIRIAYVDYREHVIYDRDNILSALLIGFYSLYLGCFLDSLLGAAIGLFMGGIIFGVAYKYYNFEAFGLGDVFLLGVLGLLFGNDFLSYFCISFMASGFLVLFLIPFLGIKRLNSLEIPLAPVLLFWVPIFIYLGKPSIISILQLYM